MLQAMITVHHLETSRSQRLLWLLEELGLPYELKVYERHPVTKLAPPELKKVHPLGKSPLITAGDVVVAESAAILEYLVEQHGAQAMATAPDFAHLVTQPGTPEHHQCRFWMHYAEGSLMNWLVMKLVFMSIPTQPMPFFVRPIARELCQRVQKQLIDPNVNTSLAFIEEHLSRQAWFAGDHLTLADFQMGFVVLALTSRADGAESQPNLRAYAHRIEARPAYQRALAKGGPVVLG
jgi:glutathione S-transferase